MNLTDLFTEAEMTRARRVYMESRPGEFNNRVTAEVIEPVMDRINRTVGHDNHPSFLGYVLEYAFLKERTLHMEGVFAGALKKEGKS